MKCDELKRKYSDITGPYYGCNEVDEAIDELKKKLMPCLNGDCILTCEVVEKYGKENAELKDEIESLKASHYAEMVDAGMRERRMRRALWLARAERADDNYRLFYFSDTFGEPLNIKGYSDPEKGATKMRDSSEWKKFFLKVERKCLKKAEEYK